MLYRDQAHAPILGSVIVLQGIVKLMQICFTTTEAFTSQDNSGIPYLEAIVILFIAGSLQ